MNLDLSEIGLVSHGIAAAAYLALLVLCLIGWRRGVASILLVCAVGLTFAWAGAEVYSAWMAPGSSDAIQAAVRILEVSRSGAWVAFLLAVLVLSQRQTGLPGGWRLIAVGTALVVGADIACILIGPPAFSWLHSAGLPNVVLLGNLILAVIGILCVENLLRNTPQGQRWSIKFLCLGLGGMFGYDFFLFSEALLFHRVSNDLFVARGIINALVVPLIALSARRNPEWSVQIFVSRQVVMHTATLVAAGVYLIAMSAAGFYVRDFGGEWGLVLQASLIFATLLLLLLFGFSGTFRARLKALINRHFFTHKYDYREEWLRFISTVSSTTSGARISLRVAEAIANIVESPEAAIWITRGSDGLVFLDSWHYHVPRQEQAASPAFFAALSDERGVIDIAARRGDGVLPEWLTEIERAWLAVPLIHHDDLLGFILLGRPRATREVEEEDLVLLKTVGRQAASYLTEQQSAQALAESKQFDEFNRRFAFVLHDVKNLVSQLSLMLQNSEKFRGNPDFQDDMLATVRESVDKLNQLMVRIHEGGREASAVLPVNLSDMLRSVAAKKTNGAAEIGLKLAAEDVAVVADENRLAAVLSHLIDNAEDAVEEGGDIHIGLSRLGGEAVIDIRDTGAGMSAEFIRDQLFKPFSSTKKQGFGIGVFECREFVYSLGGRFDVESRPGAGTAIRIVLPTHGASSE